MVPTSTGLSARFPVRSIDFRPGFEAESYSLYLTLPDLLDLDKKRLPPQQWRQLLLKLVDNFRTLGGGGFSQEGDTLVMTGLTLQGYPEAKQYLVEHGRSAAEVEAMPVAQVILLYTVHTCDELRDDQFKWLFLPYVEASKGLEQADRSLKEALVAHREIIPIAALLLPGVQACRTLRRG